MPPSSTTFAAMSDCVQLKRQLELFLVEVAGPRILTRWSGGILVQHITMPWKGLDGSNGARPSWSEEYGGDSIISIKVVLCDRFPNMKSYC